MAGEKTISVIVPESPFVEKDNRQSPCLCALDVDDLMEWWPGVPHHPHKAAEKVRAIQRSLDWKRVASIAAYLLQEEICDASRRINEYFENVYEPRQNEPGRQWPPKVGNVVHYTPSIYPVFSNVLIHANGIRLKKNNKDNSASLEIDPNKDGFNLTVIDGQHRINGAYLALQIKRENDGDAKWQVPAEVFIDLDEDGSPPKHQAQIFIDVNFYQKKVDRSLVADLFPTARAGMRSLDDESRAQDVARKLMLETGPLVGMVQIPGVKYGVKDVIALATLVSAVKSILPYLKGSELTSLSEQVDFLVLLLDAWLRASGRKELVTHGEQLTSGNVAYQGRILVTVIGMTPIVLWKLSRSNIIYISDKAEKHLESWLHTVIKRAGFLNRQEQFIDKDEFKKEGFLGSGGIGRFRDRLWAATDNNEKRNLKRLKPENISDIADQQREKANTFLGI